jgi:hypothetical protein
MAGGLASDDHSAKDMNEAGRRRLRRAVFIPRANKKPSQNIRAELKIAQCFNAGHRAVAGDTARHDKKGIRPTDPGFLSSLVGLDLRFVTNPALKRWAIVKLVPPLPSRIFRL